MDKRFQITFKASEEGELLRTAIERHGISKRGLTSIKYRGGNILVNGEEKTVRYQLKKDDKITIIFPLEEVSEGLIPESGTLNIVYEDEALLIIDKPPFINTIPSREHPVGSIANIVCGYFAEKGIPSTVHIVTRLDRDTSGLLCIAKHSHIHHLMGIQQKKHQINKQYEAIVHGHLSQQEQSIIAPIARKESSIIEREVCEQGQYAHTDVKVLQKGYCQDYPVTHVRSANENTVAFQ
ncbi:Pseudouridine synthase OS=Ureibacillus acetophenoni OX=614649 GN=SAMN05877842_101257 PE=3 SV=1 [Ureibacillus acetophenoni]